jgi:hypothetical protein
MQENGKIILISILVLLAVAGFASASPVEPILIPKSDSPNPTCEKLNLIGFQVGDQIAWIEAASISMNDGYDPFVTPYGTIYIDAYDTDVGPVFDWYTVGFAPEVITVHGGSLGTNLYDYRTTPALEMADTELHSPMNPSGKWAGLSVIQLCGYVTPEFPTIALPAGMIVGFLGIVTLVRGRKE